MSQVSTIYIHNINEKVKIEDLKKALKAVFSQFGEIVEVIAAKNLKMRGQAFVAFKEHSSAVQALKTMNGFPFYDKCLKVQLAKKDADCIAKERGTYIEKPKIPIASVSKKKKRAKGQSQLSQNKSVTCFPPLPSSVPSDNLMQPVVPNVLFTHVAPVPPILNSEPLPNNVLFVSDLPKETNEMMLTVLFQPFPGYKEIRLVPGRTEIAFVEFDTAANADFAKNNLQGFKLIAGHPMSIKFANK